MDTDKHRWGKFLHSALILLPFPRLGVLGGLAVYRPAAFCLLTWGQPLVGETSIKKAGK
jgi:hypothetical protein